MTTAAPSPVPYAETRRRNSDAFLRHAPPRLLSDMQVQRAHHKGYLSEALYQSECRRRFGRRIGATG